MSKDLNDCKFIGRIGHDIDLKYMPSGKAVTNVNIACGDDYTDKQSGEKVEQTNWIRLVFFGRHAEVLAEYCGKGSQIFVSGKQVTRKWQDKNGQDQYTTEIVVGNMQMLGSPSGKQKEPEQRGYNTSPQGEPDFDDRDIPF